MDDTNLPDYSVNYQHIQDVQKVNFFLVIMTRGLEYYTKENSERNLNLNRGTYELEQTKSSDRESKETNMNEYSSLSTVDDREEQTKLRKKEKFEIKT